MLRLVEVPVLLALTYVSLYLRDRLNWGAEKSTTENVRGRKEATVKHLHSEDGSEGACQWHE